MKNIILITLIALTSIKSFAQSNSYLSNINHRASDSLKEMMGRETYPIFNKEKYKGEDGLNEAGNKVLDSIKEKYESIAKTIFTSEVETDDYKTDVNPYNQFDNVILFTKDYGDVRVTFGSNKSFITCRGMKDRPYSASFNAYGAYQYKTLKLDKDVIIVKTSTLLDYGLDSLSLLSNKGESTYIVDSENKLIKDLVEYINPEINKLLLDGNAVFEISRSEAIRFEKNNLNSKIIMKLNDDFIYLTLGTDGIFYSDKGKTGKRTLLNIIKYENKKLTFNYKYLDINKTLTLSNIH